jgi:TPR repeat protein
VQSVPQAATPQGIFQRAVDLYNQGRYAEALPLYQGLAEQGDVKAQFNLAFMYDIGLGVAQNYTQAAYWIGKAAEQGDAQAQFMLGVMYVLGRGVAQNDAQAAYWYGKAAEQGNTNAIAALKELRQ